MPYTYTAGTGETERTVVSYSVAETAKLIRAKLAKAFPGTKFYVRSKTYSGGGSVTVYFDGIVSRTQLREHPYYVTVTKPGAPAKKAVEDVLAPFEGRGFDGMTDLAFGINATMDEAGNVTGTKSAGGGMREGWDASGPGQEVSFGANYVFVNDELPYEMQRKENA